jgi:hypothetical protein
MLLSGSIVETRTTQSNRRRNYFGSIMEGRIRIAGVVLCMRDSDFVRKKGATPTVSRCRATIATR